MQWQTLQTSNTHSLQIAYSSNQPLSAYNYPSIHQSAPVPKQNASSNVAFNAVKPPQSAQVIIAQKQLNQNKPALTSTPPPPPMATNNLSVKKQTERDITSITPQSHANLSGNSASNHSANSSVTATTMIESVSNHSLQHGVHSPHNGIKQAYIHKLSVPKLNNPLPPQPQKQAQQVTESLVIPMLDQNNYSALMQQMYPSQMMYPSHPQHVNPFEKYSYPRSQYAQGKSLLKKLFFLLTLLCVMTLILTTQITMTQARICMVHRHYQRIMDTMEHRITISMHQILHLFNTDTPLRIIHIHNHITNRAIQSIIIIMHHCTNCLLLNWNKFQYLTLRHPFQNRHSDRIQIV